MLVPVFPLNNLVGLSSGTEGRISVSFLHLDGLTTFSWEPFQGQLGSRGINSISLSTSLPYKPIYSIIQPIVVDYNGIPQIGKLSIDPKAAVESVKFFFGVGNVATLYGDIIQVAGGTITFISG
jgi:hypothetical protein